MFTGRDAGATIVTVPQLSKKDIELLLYVLFLFFRLCLLYGRASMFTANRKEPPPFTPNKKSTATL